MPALSEQDRAGYLNLVDEIQNERATKDLDAEQVPRVLLPYQIKWQQDKKPVRLSEKSRRIGWTWGMASESVLEAAEQDGMDQFYVGYNLPMAAEFIGDCAFFCKAFSIAASAIDVSLEQAVLKNEKRDIVKYSITLSSGNKIEALSSNPHNFRGRQGHARIDEAAFHNDLAELLKAALAFLIWGGRVDIISTHNGDDNAFNQLIREIDAGKLDYSHHKVTFDDALKDGFYRRICLIQGKDWTAKGEAEFREHIVKQYGDGANEELFCIPNKGSGVYLPRVLIERCMSPDIPVLRYALKDEDVLDDKRLEKAEKWFNDVVKPVLDSMPTDQRSAFGQDFGRSGDLSYLRVLQEESKSQWRTAFDLELRNIPFDVQQFIVFKIIDELPLFHHGKFDARGNGQAHAEAAMQKYGPIRIECVMATPAWYFVAFPKYKAAYEDRSILVPKSEDIIADHRRVILDKGNPKMDDGRDKGSDGLARHGDSAIAGVLAWMATEEDGQPPAGESIQNSDDVYMPMSARGKKPVSMFGRGSRLH